MPTSQMNVRIDDDIKQAGDEAFSKIGLSPSQAARSVWRYAAAHVDSPEKLAEIVPFATELESDRRTAEFSALKFGSEQVDAFLDRFGVQRMSLDTEPDYDSLLEEAYIERRAERGLA